MHNHKGQQAVKSRKEASLKKQLLIIIDFILYVVLENSACCSSQCYCKPKFYQTKMSSRCSKSVKLWSSYVFKKTNRAVWVKS